MAFILIIDDDVTLLSRLGAQLEEAGHEVARSSDVAHGAQLFAERRPDLVVLEVRAGAGAGWELLERLAAEIPVVVLSGAGREEEIVRGLDAGAADYIAKPYRSAELLARIRARLAGAPSPALTAPPQPEASPIRQAATPTTMPRRGSRRGKDDEESVFMSEAEEMALLRMPPPPRSDAAPLPDDAGAEPQSIGRRMRAERLRRHLTLVQVENDLRIRMSYLQALEDEKFTLLPRGPAALQMVRGYAEYLGMDADAVLDEYRRQHYVEAAEPPPALGSNGARRELPRGIVLATAVLLALAVGIGAIVALDPGFFGRLPDFAAQLWERIVGILPGGG